MTTRRVLILVVRVALLLVGLRLLLGPEREAPNAAFHQGQVLARAIGGLIAVLAVFPFGSPRDRKKTQSVPEELQAI